MKRIAAFFLIICLSVLIFAIPTSAEGEVFVSVGNVVLPLTDAMPIRSNNVWYIDYQCFTKGDFKINASYNATEGRLVLYTWDITLIFDLNSSTAHTVHDKVEYKTATVAASGTVYIPAQFTAQILGLEYYYNPELPLIRIKTPSDIPNSMFSYIAKKEIPGLLEKYKAEKAAAATKPNTKPNPNPVSKPNPTPQTNQTNTVTNLRLTFNITDGENLSRILSSLSRYGLRATFFIKGDAVVDYGDDIRRLLTSGHALGIFADTTDELLLTNKKLFDVTKTKTRLVRFDGGSSKLSKEDVEAVIASGFRIWDYSIMPTDGSASKFYSQATSKLSPDSRSQVLALSDTPSSMSALPQILSYLNSNNYGSFTVNILDTPVNQISERR